MYVRMRKKKLKKLACERHVDVVKVPHELAEPLVVLDLRRRLSVSGLKLLVYQALSY
jgi:hypothetical protein